MTDYGYDPAALGAVGIGLSIVLALACLASIVASIIIIVMVIRALSAYTRNAALQYQLLRADVDDVELRRR